jgi:hypothetical protein
MKSLKTYNMDHDCIKILNRESNKSQFVCRAVRRMSRAIDDFDVGLVGTRYLLINLKHRDISDALRSLIELELSTSA